MAIPLERLEGKYEILEKIQEGGMGAIYKVRHRLLDEVRVIKILRPHLREHPDLEARFLEEARAAIQLSHPSIAQIYDCSLDDDGAAYIVMEFIQGMTLAELLARGEPVPVPLALEIARQSLRALAHVHGHAVAHRDISPDNLMLTRDVDGRPLVKLIDLGIAKPVDGGTSLTGAGVFLGKFRYAAPETFEEAPSSDRRSGDLYSFALVLYELLTGTFPISGDSPSSLIAGHLFRPPVDFSRSDPQGRVPEPVRQALMKALAKAPEDRFADAESFAAALPDVDAMALTTPEVHRILKLSGDDSRARPEASQPGSTQSRLDLHFTAEPTPPPILGDASTQILKSTAAAPGSEARTQIMTVVPTDGGESTRALDANELVARARERAQAEDFENARDLLKTALEVAPEHPTAGAILASVEACIGARSEEAREAAEMERTITGIRVALGSGNKDQALDDLTLATQRFGNHPELTRLRDAAVGDAATDASEDPTTLLRPPTVEAPTPAIADLGKSLASIRELRDQGRAGDAMREMNDALREFGPQPELQTLRHELAEDLLEREAKEEETASQMFELPPSVVEEAKSPPLAATPDLPASGNPSPSEGLLDADLRTSAGPPTRHAPRRAPRRSAPPGARSSGSLVAIGLALVAVFAVLVFVLTREEAKTTEQPKIEDVTAIDANPGILVLDAVPWAEIVELENPAAEEQPAVTPSRNTPVALRLPPGEYRLVLRYPPTGQSEEHQVSIESGGRVELRVAFAELDAASYFEQLEQ